MIRGIHHVAMSVPDIERAKEFYCGILGFEEVQPGDIEPPYPEADEMMELEGVHAKGTLLKAGYGYLELWEFVNPRPEPLDGDRPVNKLGLNHFSLAVDDLQAEYERLKKHVRFHREPLRHSVEGPENVAWTVYGRDPFGNVLEFWQLGHEDPQLFAPEE